jgi:Fe2+ or Zn2+ uptake regulation protein
MPEPNPQVPLVALTLGQRQTVQREQISDTLEKASGPLTALQISEFARCEVPDVGLSTVYRALKMLQEANLVRLVTLPDGVPRYEKTGRGPHHFHCRTCGGIWTVQRADVTSVQGERLIGGFLVEDHESTFHGQCAGCNSTSSTITTRCV